MAFLPFLYLLDHLEELEAKGNEPADHAQCALQFLGFRWREDHPYDRLRAAFEHVLAFLIETGDDRIVIFEGHYQGRQRDGVIAAILAKTSIGSQPNP